MSNFLEQVNANVNSMFALDVQFLVKIVLKVKTLPFPAGKGSSLANGIGAIIREARRAKSISQEDLAERVDIAAQSLSKIERGHRVPTLQTMLAIMRELHMPPQVLTPFVRVSVDDHRASLESELLLTATRLSDDEIKLAIAQLRALAAYGELKRG